MRFNTSELIEFALPAGEQEGRLTHKPPPRTLYDTAYKERWFKLRANCLFYYRLNEFGGVDKNEPSGVFILENCEVKREENAEAPFGFAIQWKDDPERKHLFFAQNEQSVHTWVTKIVRASYEHLRAQLIMLRVQIRRKTGKDPLEQFGTPLPQRASWTQELQHAKSFESLCISPQTPASRALSGPPDLKASISAPSTKPSLPSRSPGILRKIPSPGLLRRSPIPPPRREKRLVAENGVLDASAPTIGKNKASFKSHLHDRQPRSESSKDCNEKLVPKPKAKSSFISHINE